VVQVCHDQKCNRLRVVAEGLGAAPREGWHWSAVCTAQHAGVAGDAENRENVSELQQLERQRAHTMQAGAASQLHIAVQQRDSEAVSGLLAAGADVNARAIKGDGATPLFSAAAGGYGEIVSRLVAAGAALNAATQVGTTPLWVAAYMGHDEIVSDLTAAGANLNAAVQNGATPLYIAAQRGHGKIVSGLVAAGARVNKTDHYGLTPLYIAAARGHVHATLSLLVAGSRALNSSQLAQCPPDIRALMHSPPPAAPLIAAQIRLEWSKLGHARLASGCLLEFVSVDLVDHVGHFVGLTRFQLHLSKSPWIPIYGEMSQIIISDCSHGLGHAVCDGVYVKQAKQQAGLPVFAGPAGFLYWNERSRCWHINGVVNENPHATYVKIPPGPGGGLPTGTRACQAWDAQAARFVAGGTVTVALKTEKASIYGEMWPRDGGLPADATAGHEPLFAGGISPPSLTSSEEDDADLDDWDDDRFYFIPQ
jgi:hypothetical protein